MTISEQYAAKLGELNDELEKENAELRAEIERLKAERDFARDAVVQKCRQYEADMRTMQDALNREIVARAALEPKP